MNICFLMGKIVSDIEFKFITDSKHTAISMFTLEGNSKCVVRVKAYDELADKCYQRLRKEDMVLIKGKINGNIEIIVNSVEIV